MGNSMYHYWKSQPEVLRQILEQRKSQTKELVKLFCAVNPDKLYLIGSGTSLNAERAAAGYKLVFAAMVLVGAVMKLDLAWALSDTFNGLMMLPNLVGVVGLSGVVVRETQAYLKRK